MVKEVREKLGSGDGGYDEYSGDGSRGWTHVAEAAMGVFFSFLYREAGEFRVASCRVDKVKENGGVRKETAAVGAIAMGEASSSTQRLSDPGLSLTGLELLRATPGPGFHGLLGEVSALVR